MRSNWIFPRALFAGFLLVTFNSIQAAELTPELRLRKLSLHLKGQTPLTAEYRELRSALSAGTAATDLFFTQTTKRYLASPEHVGKTIDRLGDLFRLKGARGFPETRLTDSKPAHTLPGAETFNTLDLLFQRIAQENLSWDTLLLSKGYEIPLKGTADDLAFFRSVAPELPTGDEAKDPAIFKKSFAHDDARLGGAVTTGRFFRRYNTTNLNRSRGRAAALFRIFLCDDMRALVEPKPGEDAELLKKAFPPPKPLSDSRSPGVSVHAKIFDEDVHGKDPACMSCHYKLDPMGRSFFPIGTILSDEPGPGRLVYKRSDGTLVDIPARGLGEIAYAITLQPEYERCQVSHFWRWFIRGDESPSAARLESLVKKFNEVGRRQNDFIAFLVNEPEFRALEGESSHPFLKVKPILDRCTQCHSGLEDKIPDFTVMPLGKDHVHWLSRIVARLDLKHDGKTKTMPPKASAWQPSLDQLKMLKRWIVEQAPDEKGNATIDLPTSIELLKGAGRNTPAAPTRTFKESYVRYLSGHDLLRTLRRSFPRQPWLNDGCQSLTDENRGFLGENNPAFGEPMYRAPSAAFVKWFTKCAWFLAGQEIDDAAGKKKMGELLGDEAMSLLQKEPYAELVNTPQKLPWKKLSADIRLRIATQVVHQFLGPEIFLKQKHLIVKLADGLDRLPDETTLHQALRKTILFVVSQEEFLTF